jgi:hypothetical protein
LIEYNLCKEFPVLCPLNIEAEGFHTVMDMYIDLRNMQIKKEKEERKNTKRVKGKTLARRPARDNWF